MEKVLLHSLGDRERWLHAINDNNLSYPWIDVFFSSTVSPVNGIFKLTFMIKLYQLVHFSSFFLQMDRTSSVSKLILFGG